MTEYYNSDQLNSAADMFENNSTELSSFESELTRFYYNIDSRLRQLYKDELSAIKNNTLKESATTSNGLKDWLTNIIGDAGTTESRLADEASRVSTEIGRNTGGTGGTYTGNPYNYESTTPMPGTTAVPTSPTDTLTIDPGAFDELPEEDQEKVKGRLKDAGYTDPEIEDILDGLVPVDKKTTEKIENLLKESVKDNPKTIEILEETSELDIVDESGNVDLNNLQLSELIAAKNLGMDIDLTPGSKFSKHLDSLIVDLKNDFKSNPEIRDKIVDQYGIDIFDNDGNVDKEKLALVRVIDGQKTDDEYDITKIIEEYKPSETTPPATDPEKEEEEKPKPKPTIPEASPATRPGEEETEPTGPATTPEPEDMVTPTTELTSGETIGTTGPFGIDGHKTDGLATSVADSILGEAGKGILTAINKKAASVVGAPSYTIGNSSNKAAAGIIAAASVAAGGAATGGGVLIHQKTKKIRFTPADWQALGDDYQVIIEKVMTKAGFTLDEIESFKNNNYKISASVLKDHAKMIYDAIETNPDCEADFLALYEYSFLDDNKKVIDYLLFITMIIDGKTLTDDYNMYNIINQSLDNADDADFVYSGINYEDYIDNSDVDDDDLEIINDPTTTDYDDMDLKPEEFDGEDATYEDIEELEEANAAIDKEWLKGIGLDD